MICEMAIYDIEEMKKQGLSPTYKDIIRLNALGLAVQHSTECGDLYAEPRVAFLGSLYIREPTIGHVKWIDLVKSYVNGSDYETLLSVNAYALSRSQDSLPDAADRKTVVNAIDAFTKRELAPFTFEQVKAAVSYAIHGADHTALEFPVPPPGKEDAEGAEEDAEDVSGLSDPLRSVGVGIILETMALGLGMTVCDMNKLTVAQARRVQDVALIRSGTDFNKTRKVEAQANYYRTRDAIIKRLKAEKKNG